MLRTIRPISNATVRARLSFRAEPRYCTYGDEAFFLVDGKAGSPIVAVKVEGDDLGRVRWNEVSSLLQPPVWPLALGVIALLLSLILSTRLGVGPRKNVRLLWATMFADVAIVIFAVLLPYLLPVSG